MLRFSHLPSFASSFVHQTSALGTQSRQDIVQPEQRNASMVCQARDSSLFGGVRWPSHRRMLTADAALSLQPLDELMDGREWEMKEGCQADKARPVVGLSQRHTMSAAGATACAVSFDAFVESGNGLGSAMRTHLRVASTKRTCNPRDRHRIACQCSHVKELPKTGRVSHRGRPSLRAESGMGCAGRSEAISCLAGIASSQTTLLAMTAPSLRCTPENAENDAASKRDACAWWDPKDLPLA